MSIRQEVCEQVIYNGVIIATATGCSKKFIEQIGERFNIREIAFDRWGVVTEKNDGPIATIMGLDRAIRCGNEALLLFK